MEILQDKEKMYFLTKSVCIINDPMFCFDAFIMILYTMGLNGKGPGLNSIS